MTELAAASISYEPQAVNPPDAHRRSQAKGIAAIAITIVLVIAAQLAAFYYPDAALWILRCALAVMVAALCWAVATRHQRHWVEPVRQLEKIVMDIRKGNAPIEELSAISGGLGSVAQLVKEILSEMRASERAMKELKEEIRQRVASRTEALERKVSSLHHQATRDPLTGLHNRRMLEQLLPQLVKKSLEEGSPLSLLMIDVDYFKDLNDTLGHAAGDEMLRAIGQLISSTIRESDYGFRCGGDEFVIVLPSCDQAPAHHLSERLGSLVDGLTSTLKVARRPKLSVGIASLIEIESKTAEDLMRSADEMLYAIKAARKGTAGR
jgi:diguanylate cyclase (GGDEF)-like protein